MFPTLKIAAQRFHFETKHTKKGLRQEWERVQALARYDWALKPLNEVSPPDLRRYRDQNLLMGRSSSTIRLMLSMVSVVYKHARHEWGYAIKNPVEEVKLPKPSRPRSRRLERDEQVRLFEELRRCRNPYVELAAVMAIETGMRRSELLSLRWCDVDTARGLAHLENSKNDQPRWVPLTALAIESLARNPSLTRLPRELIFPISPSLLTQAWGHALGRAGIADLRWHDLRHEALSRWAHRLSGDVFKLSLVSGHKTLQMAQRYVHPVQAELMSAMERGRVD